MFMRNIHGTVLVDSFIIPLSHKIVAFNAVLIKGSNSIVLKRRNRNDITVVQINASSRNYSNMPYRLFSIKFGLHVNLIYPFSDG